MKKEKEHLARGNSFIPPAPLYSVQNIFVYLNRWFLSSDVTWDIEGIENWKSIPKGTGIIAAVKHAHPNDVYVIYEIAHRAKVRCLYLTVPEVFEGFLGLQRFFVRAFGGFAVERGGRNVQAIRFIIEELKKGDSSLVVFPEGELFYLNDYVTPLKQGNAYFALEGAKARSLDGKPDSLYFLPIALKYVYQEDITSFLKKNLSTLEEILFKKTRTGEIIDRIQGLMDELLSRAEKEFKVSPQGKTPEEKFWSLSQLLVEKLEMEEFRKISNGEISDRDRVFMARYEKTTKKFKQAFWSLYSLSFLPGYLDSGDQYRMMETILKINRLITGNEIPLFPGQRRLLVKVKKPLSVQPYLEKYLKPDTKKEAMQNLLTDLRSTLQKSVNDLRKKAQNFSWQPGGLPSTPNKN
jgi:1-acyl-sn-glycerol-3-phosphate acyltransferase